MPKVIITGTLPVSLRAEGVAIPQNDKERRAQNDKVRRTQDDKREML